MVGHQGWCRAQGADGRVAAPPLSQPQLLVLFMSLKQAELREFV